MRRTAIAIALACVGTAACADLFGYQDLRVSDDPGDSGAAGDDSGGTTPDGATRADAGGGGGGGGAAGGGGSGGGGGNPNLDGSVTNTDSGHTGVCSPDISTPCSDPSQLAFTCTGTAVPTDPDQQLPGLTCGQGSTQTGGTSYCCSGNWCGDAPNPNDSPTCQSCYTQSCFAPICMCDTEQGPPDGGENLCNTYEDCVYNCLANSQLSQCQDQCAPQFSQTDVNLANAGINCYAQYCASPCGW